LRGYTTRRLRGLTLMFWISFASISTANRAISLLEKNSFVVNRNPIPAAQVDTVTGTQWRELRFKKSICLHTVSILSPEEI
jgi:hypothetical protein